MGKVKIDPLITKIGYLVLIQRRNGERSTKPFVVEVSQTLAISAMESVFLGIRKICP